MKTSINGLIKEITGKDLKDVHKFSLEEIKEMTEKTSYVLLMVHKAKELEVIKDLKRPVKEEHKE